MCLDIDDGDGGRYGQVFTLNAVSDVKTAVCGGQVSDIYGNKKLSDYFSDLDVETINMVNDGWVPLFETTSTTVLADMYVAISRTFVKYKQAVL